MSKSQEFFKKGINNMNKLTLDEAIEREKEIAERNRKDIEFIKEDNKKYDKSSNSIKNYENIKANDELIKSCMINAEYHRYIADALEELKRRREKDNEIMGSGVLNEAYKQGYKKAVEDFVAKYKFCDNRSMQCRKALNCADCIAKQLKKDGEQALKNANKCCGTCLYFCGEVGEGEQFCDEKEIYVSEKNWCCKYKSKDEE